MKCYGEIGLRLWTEFFFILCLILEYNLMILSNCQWHCKTIENLQMCQKFVPKMMNRDYAGSTCLFKPIFQLIFCIHNQESKFQNYLMITNLDRLMLKNVFFLLMIQHTFKSISFKKRYFAHVLLGW